MKLRIRGNSLRLRLTRGEVEQLATEHQVEESVTFGPGVSLTYAIACREVPSPVAAFDGTKIVVSCPPALVSSWARSEEVGFEAEQSVGEGKVLRILVEKDWNCLTSRPGEEDIDTFPNPHKSC